MPTYQATAPAPPSDVPEEQVDPTGQKPHGYYRDKFFGTLGEIRKEVEFSGHHSTISLRILEADEARQCARYAFVRSEGQPNSDDYLLAATICRIAFALQEAGGLRIDSECKTFDQRLQLAAELSETLQEAIIAAYDEARYEPIAFLQEMAEDPTSGRPPTPAGLSSEPEVAPAGIRG